ncbi:DNA polymerase III subunit delta' [Croceibacterium sp. TMG7-5b_MA50]|uniref:DNA polymerase III subunit delta' n=1 Tax=Croceibacterium sp. TMG7-5b_MA50 TaxID=3121290 RepID=UPI003221528E
MLTGHDQPWAEWRAAIAGARMHHGWILAGRRGIGKRHFALAAAHELVAEPGAPAAGDHPDILLLQPQPTNAEEEKKREEGRPYQTRRNITVDQLRQMQARLTTRPTLGARRAIIIDAADDLEPQGANALLKSLEEPPVGSFFLLVAHRLGRLLPTIRSRCRVLQFPELPAEQIDAILRRQVPQADAAARAAAIASAGGSPGIALNFVELDLGPIHHLMQEIVTHGDHDLSRRGRLADTIGACPDRQRQLAIIDLARAVAVDRLYAGSTAATGILADTHADLVRLGAQASTHNFDAGLLVMEIGGLLARMAVPREAAHG